MEGVVTGIIDWEMERLVGPGRPAVVEEGWLDHTGTDVAEAKRNTWGEMDQPRALGTEAEGSGGDGQAF